MTDKRKQHTTYQFTGHSLPNMEVNTSTWYITGSTAPQLATGSRGWDSAEYGTGAEENVISFYPDKRYPTNVGAFVDAKCFFGPTETLAKRNAIEFRVISFDLTADEPYIKCGFVSSSVNTSTGAVSGTYVAPTTANIGAYATPLTGVIRFEVSGKSLTR